ncbi:MAG TPA: ATP phosphoribosyltransferase, partial [Phototrophicaceae bacterium]|nr:ATP phosphoribosyltransferase [Phototrophicaceae bacterium]
AVVFRSRVCRTTPSTSGFDQTAVSQCLGDVDVFPATITLALPSKGAIADPTLNFLRDCGLRVEKPNQRQYTGNIPAIPAMNVLFQRVNDVLYKVADGTVQIGITGLDIVQEHPHQDVLVVHEGLGYGHCSLVVAVPETWVDVDAMLDLADVAFDFREHQQRNLRVATKYPTLTRQFFYRHGLHHFTLVNAEGAIEAAPTLGYADIIVDVTQTGTTLRENHLKVLADGVITEAQACLIGNRRQMQQNPAVLNSLRLMLEYIDGALIGRNYYQVTVNIQGEDAESVAQKIWNNPITRGLQGPTIAPIYGSDTTNQGQWYTVTIIVSGKDLLPAVEYVRTVGGTQTIVTPVRYVFLERSPSYLRLLDNLKL